MDKNFILLHLFIILQLNLIWVMLIQVSLQIFLLGSKKIDGFDVNFLTGTDEHGLKIQRAAEKRNRNIKFFVMKLVKLLEILSKKSKFN